jgi:CzcA family heavy metal efflux pump
MLESLIHWSLRNRILVIFFSVILLVLGGFTLRRMPVDVFPDLTAPTVTVLTEAHSMAPTEVESLITVPIESALNGASGVRRVRSASAIGLSVVWIEFDWGTDIREARQTVNEKLAIVNAELPPEIDRPVLAPVSSIMGEILFISLTSDQHSPLEVRAMADSLVRRRLLSVAGISQVTPIGGDVKQYQVTLDPLVLQSRKVSLEAVTRALQAANQNVSAGFIPENAAEYLVVGQGRIRTIEDLQKMTVEIRNGVPLTITDLATVQIGSAPKRGVGSANAKPAVILGIQKQPGANTLELTQRLDLVLDDIASKLPAGVALNRHIFRQADFISVAVTNISHALRDGAILVVLIVLVFLGNVRATIITLTAIPLSLLVAVLALRMFDAGINTMTLGGMAIAIGALVDDAVIDVENVFRRLRENSLLPPEQRRSALAIVTDASIEIRGSILFATLIIILVFVPVFFLSGVEGRLLRPLGTAYVVSLTASLLVAVTITPVLCYYLLPGTRAVARGSEPRIVHTLKERYSRLLNRILPSPWLVTGPAIILLLVAVASTFWFGRSFLPEFNEGSLTISAVTVPGTPLAESDQLGRIVEQTLMRHPEVVSVARRTGRAELDEHAQGVESSELDVSLRMKDRSKEDFLKALRDDFSTVPGVNITIGQPISHRIDHMLSGSRANIAIKIFGPDLSRLRSLAAEAEAQLRNVPGAVDIATEQLIEVPHLRVTFDRDAMSSYGIQANDLASHVQAALAGLPVSRILERQQAYDLVVRVGTGDPWRTDTLGDLLVDTPAGSQIPLKYVANIQKDIGPNLVTREQVERKIVVSCNVAGRDVTSVVNDARKRIDPVLAGDANYRVEYGGQFESAAAASATLVLLGIVVIIGIGLILQLAFRSGRDAFLIMLNLPLALIGAVAGVFVSGGVLSIASIVGFITVFGIATRNGIMLVSHIRHLQEFEGVTDFRTAVLRGSAERLVPILMTALAAALALVPLAFGGGKPGNEIQTPMAIVILFGLLTSMVLNMIIIPALYLRFGRPAAPVLSKGSV